MSVLVMVQEHCCIRSFDVAPRHSHSRRVNLCNVLPSRACARSRSSTYEYEHLGLSPPSLQSTYLNNQPSLVEVSATALAPHFWHLASPPGSVLPAFPILYIQYVLTSDRFFDVCVSLFFALLSCRILSISIASSIVLAEPVGKPRLEELRRGDAGPGMRGYSRGHRSRGGGTTAQARYVYVCIVEHAV